MWGTECWRWCGCQGREISGSKIDVSSLITPAPESMPCRHCGLCSLRNRKIISVCWTEGGRFPRCSRLCLNFLSYIVACLSCTKECCYVLAYLILISSLPPTQTFFGLDTQSSSPTNICWSRGNIPCLLFVAGDHMKITLEPFDPGLLCNKKPLINWTDSHQHNPFKVKSFSIEPSPHS